VLRTQKDEVAYAIVGELVLISNAVDVMLSHLLIELLSLENSPFLLPVVATLDSSRKLEILKLRAKHFEDDLKKEVIKLLKNMETVFVQRNIVCHTPPTFRNEEWLLSPIAAAKMLKNISKQEHLPISEFKKAIALAESVLGESTMLVKKFQNMNIELKKRRTVKNKK
jgi:hypothetical protein